MPSANLKANAKRWVSQAIAIRKVETGLGHEAIIRSNPAEIGVRCQQLVVCCILDDRIDHVSNGSSLDALFYGHDDEIIGANRIGTTWLPSSSPFWTEYEDAPPI